MRKKSFIQKNGKIISIAAGAVVGVTGVAFAVVRLIRSIRLGRRLGLQVEEGPSDVMPDEGVAPSGIEAWAPPPMIAGGSEEFAGMSRDRRTHRRKDNPRESL